MEETHRYNSIVTSFFTIFVEPTQSFKMRSGLDLLVPTLVRCAAHKIYVPYVSSDVMNETRNALRKMHGPSFESSMDETIMELPPSIKNRIEIIDREGKEYNRIIKYMKPICNELVDSEQFIGLGEEYYAVVDFLYKLLLASKYRAEADVSRSKSIGVFIQKLKEQINDDEAKFRLDQLYGIYSAYSNPLKIETFTIFPTIPKPSIYHRISDFLDEATIIELSRNRNLLGIPSKTKISLINIRKGVRHFLLEKKYQKYIQLAMDFIQILKVIPDIKIPNIDYFRELYSLEYNPPLINLDYYRMKISKKFDPYSVPTFMFPDGTLIAPLDPLGRVPKGKKYRFSALLRRQVP